MVNFGAEIKSVEMPQNRNLSGKFALSVCQIGTIKKPSTPKEQTMPTRMATHKQRVIEQGASRVWDGVGSREQIAE